MKSDNDDEYDSSNLNGPVTMLTILWFLICGGFLTWLFVSFFTGK